MIVSWRLGMPVPAVATHATVLFHMKYHLKTKFGISAAYIQSSIDNFLFGTGQGSGASPAIWLLISTVLLSVLTKIAKRGMMFKSPDNSIAIERYSDAYVDDTQNGVNDAYLPSPWSIQELSTTLSATSQSWEKLLYCSGGALELSKCFYYLLYWKWVDGLPILHTKSEISDQTTPISLTSGSNSTSTQITLRDPGDAHKTLGIHLAPTGKDTVQAEVLRNSSNRFAALIATSNLSRLEALLAYRTSWIPSVTYCLSTTCLTARQLDSAQSPATCSFLSKIGVNRNFPRAVVFGPLEYGGLDFRN